MNATSTLQIAGHRQASAAKGHLRLTRRGRLVFIGLPLMLVSVLVLLLLGGFTAPVKASTGADSNGSQAVKTTVMAGQTLWSIASASDPSRDTRDVISDILFLNNLTTSVVQPGQQLFVPLPS